MVKMMVFLYLDIVAGFKALNKTQLSTSSSLFNVKESIAFVTVFTSYNSTPVDSRSSDLVTVGNASYNKVERAMAILNVFINFIQVLSPKNTIKLESARFQV